MYAARGGIAQVGPRRATAHSHPRRLILKIRPEGFTGNQIGIKNGVWGESRLTFESIVEEVRRFVARMPPADSTTALACCLCHWLWHNISQRVLI
jgi:hypothetical protein